MEELNARHFLQNNQLKFANLSAEMTKRTISSPIDGEFSECFVSPGNIVMVGELVGVVHSNDRIIEVSLNEEDFVALEEGMAVAVNLFSMGEQVLFAKISSLSSSVEPQSGTRKLFVSMDDEANIPVGSSGKAEIILLEKNDALVLPTKALLGDSVLVVSSGVVEKRKVVTGAQNLKTVEIIEGIGVSEQVIVETPHLFQSGDRVNPTLLDFKD
jgi:HlyD family secretion protein